MTDFVKGNFLSDGATGILFWDQMGFGSLIQGMLAGQMTPKQVLEAIDTNRAKVAKAAGTTGF
jgi:hypothetical protein